MPLAMGRRRGFSVAMNGRRLFAGLAFAAVAATAGVLAESAPPASAATPGETAKAESGRLADRFTPEQFAAALLAETNRVRAAHGRRALKPLAALQSAAEDQACTLALTGRCEHYSPVAGQHDALERTQRHGPVHGHVGENVLAMDVTPHDEAPLTCEAVAADAVAHWMASPGHRASLLSRDFTQFGAALRFGLKLGKNAERVYGVQVFAGP